MRSFPLITAVAAAAAVAACAGPRQVEQSPPTVTYSYQDQDDFDEIERRADLHCEENYNRGAVLIDRDLDGDGYEATFACE
jgi:hypothetical protein